MKILKSFTGVGGAGRKIGPAGVVALAGPQDRCQKAATRRVWRRIAELCRPSCFALLAFSVSGSVSANSNNNIIHTANTNNTTATNKSKRNLATGFFVLDSSPDL